MWSTWVTSAIVRTPLARSGMSCRKKPPSRASPKRKKKRLARIDPELRDGISALYPFGCMEHGNILLTHAMLYLAAAVFAAVAAHRLGLASVAGYLLAGVAVGPF